MNIKVENIKKNVIQLEIEVDSEVFEQGMQKSYLKNAKKFNIPGFRKGKAPRKMAERYYGEQALYEDAVNFVCPDAYDKAIEENNIQAVDKPEIDIKEIGTGQNLIFTAKVTTRPEVELGQYKGVEIKKVEYNITDEDVEKELKDVAEKNARLITVEDRGIQTGDTAIIDFEGFIDDVPFEGGKGTGYNLVIGSGQFIPGFEDQLIGSKTQDDVEVNVPFPDDYNSSELAGKQAKFYVKIKDIKLKELPALDDEFAKDVSEFDTLEAYKENLKNKLVHNAQHKAEHEMEDALISKVVENAGADIPEVMVEKRIDGLVRDFDYKLRYQGIDINKYLEITGMDNAAFRKQLSARAENEVKTQLVLEEIGKAEQLTVSEEETNEEIEKMAEKYKQSKEEFMKHFADGDIEYIKGDLAVKKTVDFLVKNMVVC